ncbi:MAG: hypothetical protein ACKVPJ_02820 [Chitinophagales bacterium]
MNRKISGICLCIVFLISIYNSTFSQIVGTNCFLKGNYIHLGVNNCGAYGSNAIPPTGYSYNVYSGLGFTTDNAMDGWSTGWPQYCGDYFVPGSPVEGWGFQIGAGTIKYNTDQYCYPNDIPGSISSYSYVAGVYSCIWEGDFITATRNIHFKQETILKEDETYFVTRITMTNNGSTNISNMYYMRNVDPDQDQPWSYDFTTYNEVINQPPTDPQALVTSEGLTYGCFLGLGSKDPNSRVTYGNFSTNTYGAKAVYDGTMGYYQSGNMTSDIANSISFLISSIPVGESYCVAFAYVLDPADIDEALDNTLPVSFTIGGIPATSGDTIAISPGVPIDLSIIGYAGYTYSWSPGTGLSSTTGTTVTATVSSTTTYTISGSGTDCGNLTGTITLIPIVLPVEITYFAANCMDAAIGLQWETANEIHSETFFVERSADGVTFSTIAELPAAGYSSSDLHYSYTDKQPAPGMNYYRLKQVDFNGVENYSDVITAECTINTNQFEIMYASATNGVIDLSLFTTHQGVYTVELIGMQGQTHLFRNIEMQHGTNNIQIPLGNNASKECLLAVVTDKANGKQIARKLLTE